MSSYFPHCRSKKSNGLESLQWSKTMICSLLKMLKYPKNPAESAQRRTMIEVAPFSNLIFCEALKRESAEADK